MEYSHEIIMPNDDIPFKMFIFEGRDGNYIREKYLREVKEDISARNTGTDQ